MQDENLPKNTPLTPEIVANVRKVQLELLMKVDEICKRNNIHYVLFAGTLLGAVRHQGFIPWDDDVDLAMPREHYERFLDICKKGLGKQYFLQTTDTDPEYFNLFARLRKNGTLYVQSQYQHFSMHHGIFIDIFPLDTATSNSLVGSIHRLLVRTLRFIYRTLNFSSNRQHITKMPIGLKRQILLLAHLLRLHSARNPTKNLYQISVQLLKNQQTYLYTHLTNNISKRRYYKFMITESELLDTVQLRFERKLAPTPRSYDEWLTSIYGNYMTLPPEKKRHPHHNVIAARISTNEN